MVCLKAAIQGFSLKQSFYFMYTWGIPVVEFISSRAAGTMPAILMGVVSFVGVSQVFCLFYYLLRERFFGEQLFVAGS